MNEIIYAALGWMGIPFTVWGTDRHVCAAVGNEFSSGLTDYRVAVGHPGGQRYIQC